MHLAMMWLVAASRSRKGMPMSQRLAVELVDAFNNTGTAVKKKKTLTKWPNLTEHSLTSRDSSVRVR